MAMHIEEYQIRQTSDGKVGILIYRTKAAAEKQARIYRANGTPCEIIPYVSPAAKAFRLIQSIAKMQLWLETTEHTSQLDPDNPPAEGEIEDTQKSLDYLENQDASLEAIIIQAREILAA